SPNELKTAWPRRPSECSPCSGETKMTGPPEVGKEPPKAGMPIATDSATSSENQLLPPYFRGAARTPNAPRGSSGFTSQSSRGGGAWRRSANERNSPGGVDASSSGTSARRGPLTRPHAPGGVGALVKRVDDVLTSEPEVSAREA